MFRGKIQAGNIHVGMVIDTECECWGDGDFREIKVRERKEANIAPGFGLGHLLKVSFFVREHSVKRRLGFAYV